jgi:hypothetical protein
MQIYLVVENVDLGYHAVQGYTDYARAEQECIRLNQEHNAQQIINLMDHCGYTEREAQTYVRYSTHYGVDTVEVE